MDAIEPTSAICHQKSADSFEKVTEYLYDPKPQITAAKHKYPNTILAFRPLLLKKRRIAMGRFIATIIKFEMLK